MPQIKPYIQQVGTPAGFNTSSRNPSVEGAEARGLQQIGSAIQNVGQVLNEVQQNKEVADGASKLSDLRLRYSQRVVQEAESGSINPEKIDEDFQNELDQIQSSYSTAGGVDYVRKAGLEIKSSIKGSVFAAQTELTNVKLKEDVNVAVDKITQLLRLDPSQRESSYKQMNEFIENLSMGGRPLDAKTKEKMRSDISRKIDVAQFRGFIANAKTDDLPKLKDALRTNAFIDRNFDDDTVRSLEKEAMSEFSWRETEAARSKRAMEDAEKARHEALMNKAYSDFENNKLSYDEVKKLDLPFDMKERLKNIIKTDNRREEAVNDGYWSSKYFQQINSGELNDARVLEQAYIDNMISKSTLTFLTSQFDYFKTPEGKQFKQQSEGMFKQARGVLVKSMMGISDPEGEAQYDLYVKEVTSLARKKIADGVSIEQLTDQNSKESLWPVVNKYTKSINEKMETQMKYMNPSTTETPKFKSIDEYEKSKQKESK